MAERFLFYLFIYLFLRFLWVFLVMLFNTQEVLSFFFLCYTAQHRLADDFGGRECMLRVLFVGNAKMM